MAHSTTIYPFVVYGVTGVPLAISTITALLISLGTDIVPAVSLSYEPAEGDIMAIKPRDAKRDRLVDKRLLVRAYAYIGVMASVAAYGGYFVTMYLHGYTPAMLWQSRKQWEDVGGDFPRIVGHEKESGAAIYEATVSGESMEFGSVFDRISLYDQIDRPTTSGMAFCRRRSRPTSAASSSPSGSTSSSARPGGCPSSITE